MFENVVKYVAEDLGLTLKEARKAVLSALTGIAVETANSELNRVIVRGFGTFKISEIAAREGKNPLTGEEMTVDAHNRFALKPADALKDFINGRTETFNLNAVEEEAPVAKKAPAKKVAPVAKKVAPSKKVPAKKAPLKKK